MEKIKCIIVEDEAPAMIELKYLLNNFEFIEILKEFYSGQAALEWALDNDFDVIFLDINLPELKGIEIAKRLLDLKKNIHIVFITAHEDFALNAFELGAVDYILKPYDEKRIERTIYRLKEHIYKISDRLITEKIEKLISNLNSSCKSNRIACECNGKFLLINIDDIYYCYIENDRTIVKTKDKAYITQYSLNEIEEKTGFFRIHRSFLVNLSKIKEIYPWFHGTYKITLDDSQKSELQVSRSKVKELKETLNI